MILLTGKAREHFEKWFFEYYNKDKISVTMFNHEAMFNSYQEVVQNAYIVDWFDTVGLFISIYSLVNDNGERRFTSDINEDYFFSCEERPLAIIGAIKTADKLYNESN